MDRSTGEGQTSPLPRYINLCLFNTGLYMSLQFWRR